MRSIFFLALICTVLWSCNNTRKQDNKNQLSTSLVSNPNTANGVDTAVLNAKPTMDFKDTLHDFGNVKEGDIVEYDFAFVNNGRTPLIISNAEGSCGCTVPEYQHDPIAPGKGGEIKVRFNSKGKSGHQEKTVFITTNSKRGTHLLFIKAEVLANK